MATKTELIKVLQEAKDQINHFHDKFGTTGSGEVALKHIDDVLKTEERVTIEVEITDEEFLYLAKAAHKKDVTINEFIEMALKSFIDSLDIDV